MSKHLETLRSVMLFATVLLLIIVLYRRLLFVMGKRKSMTATSDITVRLERKAEHNKIVVTCKKTEPVKITLHLPSASEPTVLFDGTMDAGINKIDIPITNEDRAYCKVQCRSEEFNLYF